MEPDPFTKWLMISLVGVLLATGVPIAFKTRFFTQKIRPDSKAWVHVAGVFAGALLGVILMVTVVSIALLVIYSNTIVNSVWLAPALISAAWLLFYTKKKALFLYGLLEVGSALGVIGFVAMSNQGSTGARLAAAATATYFLIRGLDNLSNSETATGYFKRRGWFQ